MKLIRGTLTTSMERPLTDGKIVLEVKLPAGYVDGKPIGETFLNVQIDPHRVPVVVGGTVRLITAADFRSFYDAMNEGPKGVAIATLYGSDAELASIGIEAVFVQLAVEVDKEGGLLRLPPGPKTVRVREKLGGTITREGLDRLMAGEKVNVSIDKSLRPGDFHQALKKGDIIVIDDPVFPVAEEKKIVGPPREMDYLGLDRTEVGAATDRIVAGAYLDCLHRGQGVRATDRLTQEQAEVRGRGARIHDGRVFVEDWDGRWCDLLRQTPAHVDLAAMKEVTGLKLRYCHVDHQMAYPNMPPHYNWTYKPVNDGRPRSEHGGRPAPIEGGDLAVVPLEFAPLLLGHDPAATIDRERFLTPKATTTTAAMDRTVDVQITMDEVGLARDIKGAVDACLNGHDGLMRKLITNAAGGSLEELGSFVLTPDPPLTPEQKAKIVAACEAQWKGLPKGRYGTIDDDGNFAPLPSVPLTLELDAIDADAPIQVARPDADR